MDRVLAGLSFVRCYIHDIFVLSKYRKEHQEHLSAVIECWVEHGLKLHPNKSTFFYSQVEYLGHMIYPRGLGVLKSKVEALASIPKPKDMSSLRASLGLANYYQNFAANFNHIAKSLIMFTRNDQEEV